MNLSTMVSVFRSNKDNMSEDDLVSFFNEIVKKVYEKFYTFKNNYFKKNK